MIDLFDLNIENNSLNETDIPINSDNILENFIGHPFNYQLNNEHELTDNTISINSLSHKNNSLTKKFKLSFSIFINKKRGRIKLNKNNSGKIHGKFHEDNMTRKIQISYINFIIDFINEITKNIGYNFKFIHLNNFYKSNVNKRHREKLKSETIENVIKNKISSKYSKINKNINSINCEKIKEQNIDILINILI